ncbi:hypothetical protein T484DRAFT_1825739, partial [Baffinella frigidus]
VAFCAVASDGSKRAEWGEPNAVRGGWMWEAADAGAWKEYMDSILADKQARGPSLSSGDARAQGAWLALNKQGRSRASGAGTPRYDELLGARLPPTSEVALTDAAEGTPEDASVRAAQAAFYAALTLGSAAEMRAVWDGACENADVSEFVALGGRLDPWEKQLQV